MQPSHRSNHVNVQFCIWKSELFSREDFFFYKLAVYTKIWNVLDSEMKIVKPLYPATQF